MRTTPDENGRSDDLKSVIFLSENGRSWSKAESRWVEIEQSYALTIWWFLSERVIFICDPQFSASNWSADRLQQTSVQIWIKSVKITFFLSSMSLVWTYTVMVPFLRGNTYQRENCILKGVSGVPTECQNHTYFQNMNLNRGVSIF